MSQIFKTNFPKDIIFEFLKEFCDKTNNFYIFSKTTFKKIKLKLITKLICRVLLFITGLIVIFLGLYLESFKLVSSNISIN